MIARMELIKMVSGRPKARVSLTLTPDLKTASVGMAKEDEQTLCELIRVLLAGELERRGSVAGAATWNESEMTQNESQATRPDAPQHVQTHDDTPSVPSVPSVPCRAVPEDSEKDIGAGDLPPVSVSPDAEVENEPPVKCGPKSSTAEKKAEIQRLLGELEIVVPGFSSGWDSWQAAQGPRKQGTGWAKILRLRKWGGYVEEYTPAEVLDMLELCAQKSWQSFEVQWWKNAGRQVKSSRTWQDVPIGRPISEADWKLRPPDRPIWLDDHGFVTIAESTAIAREVMSAQ